MERRQALKSMAVAVGGLMSLPGWANSWSKASIHSTQPFLTRGQNDVLAELVETIIPTTDTPGAKELGVPTFIQKIVTDCLEPQAQQTLSKGLALTDSKAQQAFSKGFAACDAKQRAEVVGQMASSDDAKDFVSMIKGLTIRGYMSSEYVMTNLTHYVMAPGFYHGCVPVAGKPVSQKTK